MEDEQDTEPIHVLIPVEGSRSYAVVPYKGQLYAAISYCWPAPGFGRIGCSNKDVAFATPTDHVHFTEFMQHAVEKYYVDNPELHSKASSLAVWIDYHCINQNDKDEKAQQVAALHKIYRKAQITLVMLEDTALSENEHAILWQNGKTDVHISLIRRIIGARWFSRAWCSQELILSHRVHICVHRAGQNNTPIHFPADLFWQWMDVARTRDHSLPLFSVPRGGVPDTIISRARTAWAVGVVYELGCRNEYDKAALVCNLLRYSYRFDALPDASDAIGKDSSIAHANVLKMANVIAISRRDFSLLLGTHTSSHPLLGKHDQGFRWAGQSVFGDRTSEMWVAKDYEVDRDPDITIDQKGLVVRGIHARIVHQHNWQAAHDSANPENLDITVDGVSVSIARLDLSDVSWTWTNDLLLLRNLLIALAAVGDADEVDAEVQRHARIVIAYLFDADYAVQPEPMSGKLTSFVNDTLSSAPGDLQHIARAITFVRQDNATFRFAFSTIVLDDPLASVLLVHGNVQPYELEGKLLFQPWVIRPKLFSPPFVLTANSMVLKSQPLEHRRLSCAIPGGCCSSDAVEDAETDRLWTYECIGAVRGLGMILEAANAPEKRVRIV
jgi:hypothetical protein